MFGPYELERELYAMIQTTPFRSFAATLASFVLIGCATGTSETAAKDVTETNRAENTGVVASELLGTWDVSLFFSETAPPSSTVMEIRSVNNDGTIEGTFYNTEFESARYAEREGVVAFTIITSDGTGQYATSGRLSNNDFVEGQTFSTGRDFLMTWVADRR